MNDDIFDDERTRECWVKGYEPRKFADDPLVNALLNIAAQICGVRHAIAPDTDGDNQFGDFSSLAMVLDRMSDRFSEPGEDEPSIAKSAALIASELEDVKGRLTDIDVSLDLIGDALGGKDA